MSFTRVILTYFLTVTVIVLVAWNAIPASAVVQFDCGQKGNLSIHFTTLPRTANLLQIQIGDKSVSEVPSYRAPDTLRRIIKCDFGEVSANTAIRIMVRNAQENWFLYNITVCGLEREEKLGGWVFPGSGLSAKFIWNGVDWKGVNFGPFL